MWHTENTAKVDRLVADARILLDLSLVSCVNQKLSSALRAWLYQQPREAHCGLLSDEMPSSLSEQEYGKNTAGGLGFAQFPTEMTHNNPVCACVCSR